MILEEDDYRLYFTKISGAGTIRCIECDFEQNIVCFLHGVDDWNKTGYQCQKCGKFYEIEYGLGNTDDKKCDCEGKLDRDQPIFCPKCKTNKVSYRVMLIT